MTCKHDTLIGYAVASLNVTHHISRLTPKKFVLVAGRGVPLETEAREGGILEEIRLDNSVANPQVGSKPQVINSMMCMWGMSVGGGWGWMGWGVCGGNGEGCWGGGGYDSGPSAACFDLLVA